MDKEGSDIIVGVVYPPAVPVAVPVAHDAWSLQHTDELFMQVQNAIAVKRQLLLDKQRRLKSLAKQNEFLAMVRDDFTNYNHVIAQQRHDQILALNTLNNYIQDLIASGNLTKYNLEDAQSEQAKIMREVRQIKRGLTKLDHVISNDDDNDDAAITTPNNTPAADSLPPTTSYALPANMPPMSILTPANLLPTSLLPPTTSSALPANLAKSNGFAVPTSPREMSAKSNGFA